MKRERNFGNRKNESIVSVGEYGYRVKDELGRGFSSCVYKGFHIFRSKTTSNNRVKCSRESNIKRIYGVRYKLLSFELITCNFEDSEKPTQHPSPPQCDI
jgi:hypothetical protein